MESQKALILGSYGFIGKNISYFLNNLDDNIKQIALSKKEEIDYFKEVKIEKQYNEKIHCDSVVFLLLPNLKNEHLNLEESILKQYSFLINHVQFEKIILTSTINLTHAKNNGIEYKDFSIYLKAKYLQEKIALKLWKEKLIILRCSNIVGLNQHKTALLPTIMNKIETGDPLSLYTPLERPMQFLDVSDLCNLIYLLIKNKNIVGQYNIANKDSKSIKWILDYILEKTQKELNIIEADTQNTEEYEYIDSSEIRKLTNWNEIYQIQDILNNLIAGKYNS